MKKTWYEEAWEDYLYWQTQDKKTLKKLNKIIEDTERNPYEGIGKPEPLKYEWSGSWSRKIDDGNRFIYRIKDGKLEIAQCKEHYNDK
jgi:toxin YoeB